MRPSFDTYFMRFAYLAATRASCDRKHVGAVLVTPDRRILATGYNGAPARLPDCDEVGHELVDGHCIRTLHAESNAIDYAGRLAKGCTLYTTVSPCYDCAKRIICSGIVRLCFDEFYSSRYSKSAEVPEFLTSGGVVVEQFDSPGLQLFKTHLSEMERAERIVAETTQVEWACGCQAPAAVAGVNCPMHGQPRVHE